MYRPSIDLTPALTARVSLLKRQPAPEGAGRSAAQAPGTPAMMTVREFGRPDGVARDLRESPFPMELNLSALPDGVYTLEAEVTYIEVPGGTHSDAVVPNLPKVFEFLAAHRRPRT